MKPVHFSVQQVGKSALSRARACDPTIPTFSMLTEDAHAVTCKRCRLTNAVREARS